MSRTFHSGERRIRARGVPHDSIDLRRVARALIALAAAQAEADAQALDTTSAKRPRAKQAKTSTRAVTPPRSSDSSRDHAERA